MLKFSKCVLQFALLTSLSLFGANSLEADFWSPSMEVASVNTTSIFQIALGTNDNGDSIVAWYDGNSIFTSILPISSTDTWSTPKLVKTIGSVNFVQIVVALDIHQNGAVAWTTQDVSFNYHVFLSYLPSGGAWTAPFSPTPANSTSSVLSIGIDNNGVAFVGWTLNAPVNINAFDLYFYISGAWTTDPTFPGQTTNPPFVGGQAYPPFMAGNNKGDLVAFWTAPGINSPYYLSSRVSGVWSTPIVVSPLNNFGVSISDALNSSDQVAVGAKDSSGNGIMGSTFQLSSLPATPPTFTPLFTNPFPAYVSSAINSSNNIAVIGASFPADVIDGAYYDASTMTWSANGNPIGTDPQNISPFRPSIMVSIDPSNNAPAVWLDNSNAIQTTILIAGGSWSAQSQLSAPGVISYIPYVSSSAEGRSIAIWEEVGATSSNIRFVIHPISNSPAAVTNLQGLTKGNRFLTKATFSQTLTWDPSASTGVVAYNIYSDVGLTHLIGTVSANGSLEFVIQCVFPNISTTYAVVPVTASGVLGTPTFITI